MFFSVKIGRIIPISVFNIFNNLLGTIIKSLNSVFRVWENGAQLIKTRFFQMKIQHTFCA